MLLMFLLKSILLLRIFKYGIYALLAIVNLRELELNSFNAQFVHLRLSLV